MLTLKVFHRTHFAQFVKNSFTRIWEHHKSNPLFGFDSMWKLPEQNGNFQDLWQPEIRLRHCRLHLR